MLDRCSPLSLHEQLRRLVQDEILSGHVASGDRLPSEREYCERYDVSRITVTRALGDLARLGLIERVQGRGSVVARNRVVRSFDKVIGLTDSLRSQGHVTRSEVLACERVERDEVPADLLALAVGSSESFMRLKRLRYVDETPAVVAIAYIPWSLGQRLASADFETGSLYDAFETVLGLPIRRNEQVSSLILATREVARQLRVRQRSPQFLFRGVAYAEGDRLVELTHSIFRGDLFEFKASMRKASVCKGGESLS